ncbi:hypothetical protein FRB91_004778 [Serendipita sp. 411]|nr:hypothetical protein FRB91_004778 [Serendipita sp. 411]
MTSVEPHTPSDLARLRSRAVRGTYSREALKSVFKASPIAHCAFAHDGKGLEGPDGDEKPRIMNLPMLAVLREYEREGDVESDASDDLPENGELIVYLHTYYGSRLVGAIKDGLQSLTISTTKMDGLVLSEIPKGHSVNYRSACIYGYNPTLVPNTPEGIAEKIKALQAVVDDVTGYNRTDFIGQTTESQAKPTAVVRVRIEDASCKQRIGGADGDMPPVENAEDDKTPGGERYW